jgi:hypothetical protein
MYRALILLALWAASPALGQVGSTALYTEFQHQPSPGVIQAMREETTSLLADEGLHFEWRSLPMSGHEVWADLAVLTFQGSCEMLPFASNSHPDNRLGWTHVSDGKVLPFAEVDCDAVRAFLLSNLYTLPTASRELVYGRAIGRVLAHELLHIFAGTAHHSDYGVDQPALSRADLLCDQLVLNREGLSMVRTGASSLSNTAHGTARAGQDSYLREGCSVCHGIHGEGTAQAPALRTKGKTLSSIVLAAKITKSKEKMFQRAKSLKVSSPSLAEEELDDLVRFLNEYQ